MATKKQDEKQQDKEKLIKKEIEKLNQIFSSLPVGRKELATELINNAGFLSVTLKDLREKINKDGVKEKYKNGNNQYGYKDSTESKMYDRLICDYMKIIKQLNDMLPKNEEKPPKDEFDNFGE